ncbi:hypothetical protein [Legionella worsleiensis]|uniref:VipE n=1 Tax=Legionella worsleiensis TaxID=45076 RepID=A0A0W1AJ03_9GAMM|nr:hypothetical protein [Legionella worsleiensis]KTD81200.1 VipE [Legionella worsleiensis]STY33176.1 VipE [Legionella worsleiensis]
MRDNDIKKNHRITKSLLKPRKQFKEDTKGSVFGGTHGARGQFFKHSLKTSKPKAYYLAERGSYHEYFIFEVFNAIGFSTPKARTVINDEKNTTNITMASRAIDGYMPLQAYTNWWPDSGFLGHNKQAKEIKQRYTLDVDKQVIFDNETQSEIKISGNLFAANIGEFLVQDSDFSGEGTNLSLIKKGQRFHCYFIDKDGASLLPKESYNQLAKIGTGLPKLFKETSDDQVLAIVNNLAELLNKNNSSECSNLEKIFFNPRSASILRLYLKHFIEQKIIESINSINFRFAIESEGNLLFNRFFKLEHPQILQIKSELLEAVKSEFNKHNDNEDWNFSEKQDVESYIKNLEAIVPGALKAVLNRNKGISLINAGALLNEIITPGNIDESKTYTIEAVPGLTASGVMVKEGTHDHFEFRTSMSLEEFIYKVFNIFYSNPAYGYTFNTDQCNIIPYDPVVMYNNIKHNAELIISHFTENKPDILNQFKEREAIRERIALAVIRRFSFNKKLDSKQQQLYANIVEDLRGPYYTSLFSDQTSKLISLKDEENKDLLERICIDNESELNIFLVNNILLTLTKKCSEYQNHIKQSILKLALQIPEKFIKECYHMDGSLDIDKLININDSGIECSSSGTLSNQLTHEFSLALNKYKIVNAMNNHLNDNTVNSIADRINNMQSVLSEENKNILKNRRDSSNGIKFLEYIFHILTLGIYSKASKGTFAFWKAHGESLTNCVEEKIESVNSPTF